jgi:glutathione S-transferase
MSVADVNSLLDQIEMIKKENAALEQQLAANSSKAEVIFADSPAAIPTASAGSTLVYWNICGLAQPIRYALEMAGIEYKDVRIDAGPGAPGSDSYKGLWIGKKPDVGKEVPFVNLPYFIDGDVKLAQSEAILRHIGRKYNLSGRDPAAMDLVLGQVADFDNEVTAMCYGRNGGLGGMDAYFSDALPAKLQAWSDFLGAKSFMCGSEVTVADFKIYELLRKLKLVQSDPAVKVDTLSNFPSLTAYVERVEALGPIKSYLAASSFLGRPLNNPHAEFR